MTTKPIINAGCAIAYIALVAVFMNLVSKVHRDKPDTAFAPIAFLCLLTLSASVMAYLFFYQPLLLLFDGKKIQALNFFIHTVILFALFTLIIWGLLLTGLI